MQSRQKVGNCSAPALYFTFFIRVPSRPPRWEVRLSKADEDAPLIQMPLPALAMSSASFWLVDVRTICPRYLEGNLIWMN